MYIIREFHKMEQILNTTWFAANIGALYVGLKTKLVLLQLNLLHCDVETLRYIALIIGIISSIVFLGYNISKWYHQVLLTKKLKKENNIEKLFTFVESKHSKNNKIKK